MKTKIPKELRHLQPTDRWWHEIIAFPLPFTPGEFWSRPIIQAVMGTQENTNKKKDCD